MVDQQDENLIRKDKKTYDDAFTSVLLEQYKMYVQTAENVSSRRVAVSRYLLTLSAALIAIYGLLLSIPDPGYWLPFVSVTGVFVSLLWYKLIKSHSDLNSVKFKIIHELEQHLPAALFTHEWRIARGGNHAYYTKITDIERWIPFLFIGLHVSLFGLLMWQILT